MELERIALEDDYFVEKKLFTNVDFYSGIILKAMGIPTSMFTVLFAVARTVGWVAQWREMIEDPNQRTSRPAQLSTGYSPRHHPPLNNARGPSRRILPQHRSTSPSTVPNRLKEQQ